MNWKAMKQFDAIFDLRFPIYARVVLTPHLWRGRPRLRVPAASRCQDRSSDGFARRDAARTRRRGRLRYDSAANVLNPAKIPHFALSSNSAPARKSHGIYRKFIVARVHLDTVLARTDLRNDVVGLTCPVSRGGNHCPTRKQ
jgi:hypothetical protein